MHDAQPPCRNTHPRKSRSGASLRVGRDKADRNSANHRTNIKSPELSAIVGCESKFAVYGTSHQGRGRPSIVWRGRPVERTAARQASRAARAVELRGSRVEPGGVEPHRAVERWGQARRHARAAPSSQKREAAVFRSRRHRSPTSPMPLLDRVAAVPEVWRHHPPIMAPSLPDIANAVSQPQRQGRKPRRHPPPISPPWSSTLGSGQTCNGLVMSGQN